MKPFTPPTTNPNLLTMSDPDLLTMSDLPPAQIRAMQDGDCLRLCLERMDDGVWFDNHRYMVDMPAAVNATLNALGEKHRTEVAQVVIYGQSDMRVHMVRRVMGRQEFLPAIAMSAVDREALCGIDALWSDIQELEGAKCGK